MRVQSMITESLNSFRSDITSVISNQIRHILENVNIGLHPRNNSGNSPEDQDNSPDKRPLPNSFNNRPPNGNIPNDRMSYADRVDRRVMSSERNSNIVHNWHLKFSGLPDSISVDEFIYRINNLTSIHLNSDFELLAKHAPSLFEGKAEKWFWRYVRQADNIAWFDICEALRHQFNDTTPDFDIKDGMRRRKQTPTESFDDFLDAVLHIGDKLRVPIDEAELVEIVLRKLRTDLRYELLHLNISDINTLRKEIRKHD